MSRTTFDSAYDQVHTHFLEYNGSVAVLNTYLKIALLASLVVIAFQAWTNHQTNKQTMEIARHPIVIRMTEVGRADVLAYKDFEYSPQAAELKYYLGQYIVKHYSRLRETIGKDYPESLYFLTQHAAAPLWEEETKTRWIEKFATKADEENDVKIDNITITDLRKQPYEAEINYQKIFYNSAHYEIRREKWISHMQFLVQPIHDNKLVLFNPLGVTITYFRDDQAFN
jgi:hypothetical protein